MNLMKHIPSSVTMKIGRSMLVTQKHSPTILFGVGVIGVIATAVLASRATLVLEDTLEETQERLEVSQKLRDANHEKYSENDYKKDVAIQYVKSVGSVAKLYIPTVVVGIVTIGAFTGSHRILVSRNVAAVAAYTALQKGFDEYRARVTEEFGPDKERELRYGTETHEILEETKKGEPKVTEVKRVGPDGASIYARWFDQGCGTIWSPNPSYNLMRLRTEQNYCNDILHIRGHLFLNEAYERLGMPHTKEGQFVGWIITKDDSTDNYVDFGFFNGEDHSAIDFLNGFDGAILLDFNVETILDKI